MVRWSVDHTWFLATDIWIESLPSDMFILRRQEAWRLRVRLPIVSLEFFIDVILLAALWPWDRITVTNEYQEYFLGGKSGRCVGLDNLTTFMCRLSWNLGASTCWNPQGLSRPCTGIALPLPLRIYFNIHVNFILHLLFSFSFTDLKFYRHFYIPSRATCCAHLALLNCIIRIIRHIKWKILVIGVN